ncbi:uncharacterized protein F4807DRAFT_457357 [Annulohypoxylon truncatum]|uniref:uncharacterized protein n=1 Tax=Annulohypoxylon truncatum TaxID=327061 RepID=UPI00200729B8|nr:uncharacterized protein F4807DRAFT_457357 [Annulohypoxylon truncatum]KAI1212561.1 hypothetical protein F4807DRAFT_457357 [Annulohypoxylon truncatum]
MPMAPTYSSADFTLDQAIQAAGPAPVPSRFGFQHAHEGEPGPEFFLNIDPRTAHSFFSTNNGERPFRTVENPLAIRPMEYWDAQHIQSYADELRNKFYDRCRYIQPLASFIDLYIYFDAFDIYYLGAQNLWSVIHHMYFENQYLAYKSGEALVPWIELTVQHALFNGANQQKLYAFQPETMNDIMSVFTNGELGAVHNLPPNYHNAIRSVLMTHWMNLRRGHGVAEEYQLHIVTLHPAGDA